MKRILARVASRLGLLASATDAFLYLRSILQRPSGAPTARAAPAADGLPMPPASLRFSSAGTDDEHWFLESGRLGAAVISEILQEFGHPLDRPFRILDFGCGCGRVLRQLRHVDAQLTGSDWNRRAVRWCKAHLRFAEFRVGRREPPPQSSGADESASFNLIYAFSVFTHMPAELQRDWLLEFTERLVAGGLLVLSTHGDAFIDQLDEAERASYRRGELVVRSPDASGTNVCASYHPRGAFEALVPEELEIVCFRPEGALGNPPQDLWVLRRT